MKTHSTITRTIALVATLSVAAPAAAPASPLLSGYGGPGQGDQAILGSALLNGSAGGGGSAGTGASSITVGRANRTPNRATTPGQAAAGGPSKQTTGAAPRGTDSEGAGRGGQVSGVASNSYPASEQRGVAQPSGTLGLSGEDLLYILLAFGTLAFAGVLTWRLTRTIEREAPVAK